MATIASYPDYSLYSNAFGFLRQPLNFQPQQSDANIVITGLPFDLATSGRSGSRMGPGAIRQASIQLAWEECRWPWQFALTDRVKIADAGDLVFDTGDAALFTQRLEAYSDSLAAAGKTQLSLGGDHYVTLPLLRAHHRHYGPMALVHFDAHTDTYSQGSLYDHGTMFYHAPKEGLIVPEHSIQIGIRTHYPIANHPFQVIDAATANEMNATDISRAIRARVGQLPVYLSFDIDCLDPAYAPGTGTPVCGGMTTDKILKIIRSLVGITIVGMDIVEVAPSYDQSEITALAAATIGCEMLYVIAANRLAQ
ncbi:agmatinase [Celerinatantimonas sp. YJH-8]|uniref:agmatinase n=1 Tax=Celerinatantimonas sp. YJH-8 TaxID=3228714 RepID=UPI0038BEF347